MFITGWAGLDMTTPITNQTLRSNGAKAWFGWPDLPPGSVADRCLAGSAGRSDAAENRRRNPDQGAGISCRIFPPASISTEPPAATTSLESFPVNSFSGTSAGPESRLRIIANGMPDKKSGQETTMLDRRSFIVASTAPPQPERAML